MKSKEPVMQRQNGPTQFDRFVETARALGCDEDKERVETQLSALCATIRAPRPLPPKTQLNPLQRHAYTTH